MSELAARHLRSHGAETIFVSNRTHESALRMAERVGGTAIHFDQLYGTADQADIVITSTGAPHAIFRRDHGELFMHRRKNRPMFFIDIAVPRDVDPSMSQVEGIFVYDIDDLQHVVEANVSDRGREAARAEQLVEEEVERFRRRIQSLDAVPTIVALQQRLEQIRQSEVDRLRGRLGPLSPEQETAIENLTRSIVNKILHAPITTLKGFSGSDQLASTAEFLRSIFGIENDASHWNGASGISKDDISKASDKPLDHTLSVASDENEIAEQKPGSRR